jgi:hypothetical protein
MKDGINDRVNQMIEWRTACDCGYVMHRVAQEHRLKWAIAGRSQDRLSQLANKVNCFIASIAHRAFDR